MRDVNGGSCGGVVVPGWWGFFLFFFLYWYSNGGRGGGLGEAIAGVAGVRWRSAIAGVAVGGWLVVGQPVGGGGGGLECEEVFLLSFFFLYLFFSYFLNRDNLVS